MSKKYKFGKPVSKSEIPSEPRRLPQYDECLQEFLESGNEHWKVNLSALPSKNVRIVLSSLKWRMKNKEEFKNIRVFMRKNEVYLERVAKSNE